MTPPATRNARSVVRTGARNPETPLTRDANVMDGDGGTPPSSGACETSSCDRASSKSVETRRSSLTGRPYGSRGGLFAPAARHREAQLLLRCGRRELADDASLVDDEDPVRQREDLLELERHEQDRPTGVPLLDQAAVDELDRAHVEAARRLRGDQHLRVAVDLAREHDLLLVPARERRGRRRRAPAADVELLQEAAGPREHRA